MFLPLLLMANPGTALSAAASQHGYPFRQCACHSLPQTDMVSRCREMKCVEERDNWTLLTLYPSLCRVESAGRANRPLPRQKVHLFTMVTYQLLKMKYPSSLTSFMCKYGAHFSFISMFFSFRSLILRTEILRNQTQQNILTKVELSYPKMRLQTATEIHVCGHGHASRSHSLWTKLALSLTVVAAV